MSDSLEVARKRLRFRSWHRGTREADLLLGPFADAHLAGFGPNQLEQFAAILDQPDPDLYNWMVGAEAVPEGLRTPVMELLLKSKRLSITD